METKGENQGFQTLVQAFCCIRDIHPELELGGDSRHHHYKVCPRVLCIRVSRGCKPRTTRTLCASASNVHALDLPSFSPQTPALEEPSLQRRTCLHYSAGSPVCIHKKKLYKINILKPTSNLRYVVIDKKKKEGHKHIKCMVSPGSVF